jgi:cytochrome P450
MLTDPPESTPPADKFHPPFPVPLKAKAHGWLRLLRGRSSWLEVLYERSYKMKMGHVRSPGLDTFMVNEPSLVKKILVDEANQFPKHQVLHKMLYPLLGNSIFTTNGPLWEKQRRMINPAFEHARLKTVFPMMLTSVAEMLERFGALADGQPHDMDIETTHVTADVIFRTIFSLPLARQEARAIFDAFNVYQEAAPHISMFLTFRLPMWMIETLFMRRGKAAAADIRRHLEAVIRPRYEAHQRGEGAGERDILAALLEARDPQTGDTFNFEELVDQAAIFFLAGHETSASALSWSLYLLAKCPHIQERVHQEALSVLGDRQPVYEDMRSFERARDVFREALRLYPPVGFFIREVMQTQCMRDKTMKPGSVVMISPWLMQRHVDLWDEPNAFDPDRFGCPAGEVSLQNAWLPFGKGQRICVGAAFATQEAILILMQLVRYFRFEPVPNEDPKPVGRVTIRSANGTRLIVHRREPRPGVTAPA